MFVHRRFFDDVCSLDPHDVSLARAQTRLRIIKNRLAFTAIIACVRACVRCLSCPVLSRLSISLMDFPARVTAAAIETLCRTYNWLLVTNCYSFIHRTARYKLVDGRWNSCQSSSRRSLFSKCDLQRHVSQREKKKRHEIPLPIIPLVQRRNWTIRFHEDISRLR